MKNYTSIIVAMIVSLTSFLSDDYEQGTICPMIHLEYASDLTNENNPSLVSYDENGMLCIEQICYCSNELGELVKTCL